MILLIQFKIIRIKDDNQLRKNDVEMPQASIMAARKPPINIGKNLMIE